MMKRTTTLGTILTLTALAAAGCIPDPRDLPSAEMMGMKTTRQTGCQNHEPAELDDFCNISEKNGRAVLSIRNTEYTIQSSYLPQLRSNFLAYQRGLNRRFDAADTEITLGTLAQLNEDPSEISPSELNLASLGGTESAHESYRRFLRTIQTKISPQVQDIDRRYNHRARI